MSAVRTRGRRDCFVTAASCPNGRSDPSRAALSPDSDFFESHPSGRVASCFLSGSFGPLPPCTRHRQSRRYGRLLPSSEWLSGRPSQGRTKGSGKCTPWPVRCMLCNRTLAPRLGSQTAEIFSPVTPPLGDRQRRGIHRALPLIRPRKQGFVRPVQLAAKRDSWPERLDRRLPDYA